MIQKLEIKGIHFEIDEKIKKYVGKKIGKLDRYVPRDYREPLHAEVFLTEEDGKAKNRFTCEAVLHLPHEVLDAKESTVNIYAAVDIVEAKLKTQLGKYKTKETDQHLHQRFLKRLRSAGRRMGRGRDNF